jgi:hypothetical protein
MTDVYTDTESSVTMLAVLAEHRGFVIRKMPLRYGTKELNSMTEGIMMELDEAISHALEVTRQNEDSAILYKNCKEIKRNTYEVLTAEAAEQKCLSCAAEHRQLAEWLTELKQWRRVYGVCPSYEMCIPECKEGYNAQIAEYKRLLKMAVEDISKMPCNNDTHRPDSCYICEKHGNCSYTDSFKWCKADIALKLIGDESNK